MAQNFSLFCRKGFTMTIQKQTKRLLTSFLVCAALFAGGVQPAYHVSAEEEDVSMINDTAIDEVLMETEETEEISGEEQTPETSDEVIADDEEETAVIEEEPSVTEEETEPEIIAEDDPEITEEDPEITEEETAEEDITQETEEEITPEEEEPEASEVMEEYEPEFLFGGKDLPLDGSGITELTSEYLVSGTVTYDYETDTLTLDNAVFTMEPNDESDPMYMFERTDSAEITVRLSGTSTISTNPYNRWGWSTGAFSTSGKLKFMSDDGTGVLNITSTSYYPYDTGYHYGTAISANQVEFTNCTVNAHGATYGIYGYRGIWFSEGATVTAIGDSSQALYTYADNASPVAHDPVLIRLTKYANTDDETGTAMNSPEYVYDYYGYDPFGEAHKVIAEPKEIAGNIIMSGDIGADGGNVTFTLTDEGMLTISGNGAMKDFAEAFYSPSADSAPWYDYDSVLVKHIVIEEGVSSIGTCAFIRTNLLEDVTLPSTMKKIGRYAFAYSNMTEIDLPEGVEEIGEYAFDNSRKLRQITLPSTLKKIGDDVFYYCEALQSIDLPSGLTELGNYVFYGCKQLSGTVVIPEAIKSLYGTFSHCESLEKVIMPEGLEEIRGAFYYCKSLTEADIPSTVRTIGYEAFEGSAITSAHIPEGITEIGDEAFYRCASLVDLTLPSTLEIIVSDAFAKCTSLREVSFPDGLTSIGSYAFSECTSLEEVILPDSVTTLDDYAFSSCTGLVKANTGNGLTEMGNAFQSCSSLVDVTLSDQLTQINRSTFQNCSSLETIVLPDRIRYILDSAFAGCTNLKNVSLPSGLTALYNSVFSGCESLTSIDLPETLVSISDSVFNSSGLTSITLPSALTSLGENVFYRCSALAEVHMENTMVYSIRYAAFSYCSALEELVLPDTVKGIDRNAFSNCTSLRRITFNGVLENIFSYSSYAISSNAFTYCSALESLEFTLKGKDAGIGSQAFSGVPAGVVKLYGVPGGSLESGAASKNYTFIPAAFTVKYLANGGQGEMADQEIDYTGYTAESEPYRFTENTFTNGELTFIGWNTKADGTGTKYSDEQEITIDVPGSGVLTLYAQWAKAYDLWLGGVQINSSMINDLYKGLNGYDSYGTPSTYDPDTNTLTLNTLYVSNSTEVMEGRDPSEYYGLYYAGDKELTMVVNYSSVQFKARSGTGLDDIYSIYTNGSLKIVLNNYTTFEVQSVGGSDVSSAAIYVGGDLTVAGSGSLNIYGSSGYKDHSYGIRMAGGAMIMRDNVSVRVSAGSAANGSYGLYMDSDVTLRSKNWDSGSLVIQGNGSFGSVSGAPGVKLNRRSSECDLLGYERYNTSGTVTVLGETAYTMDALASYQSLQAMPVRHVLAITMREPDRSYVYTGAGITPEIWVTCNGSSLMPGKDYTVKYANNKAAFELPEGVENDQEGFLSLPANTLKKAPKITVTGKGNYSGTAVVYFEIHQKNISENNTDDGTLPVTVSDITAVRNTKAAPLVYYGAYKLTTKDYTMDPVSGKFAEDGTLTITGKGNFTGTREIPVTVVGAKNELKNIGVTFAKKTLIYSGMNVEEEILSAITVYDAADKTKTPLDEAYYTVTLSADTKNAGTVKAAVSGRNGYSGTKTSSYKITPDKNADLLVYNAAGDSGVTYRGRAWDNIIYVLADLDGMGSEDTIADPDSKYETILTEGKDFKVTYKNNIKVSTAKTKATYTVTFLGNYKGKAAVKGSFTILPQKLYNTSITIPPVSYTKPGANLPKPYVTYNGELLKEKTDYTVKYYRTQTYDYETGGYVYSGPVSSKKGEILTDADFNGSSSLRLYAVFEGKGNFAKADEYDVRCTTYTVKKLTSGTDPGNEYKELDLSKATISITAKDAKGNVKKVTKFPYTGSRITFDPNGSGDLSYPAEIKVTYQYDKKTTLTLQYGTDYSLNYYSNLNKGKATVAVITTNRSPRYFYDENYERIKDASGNDLPRLSFNGQKSAAFTITAGKLSDLLKKVLNW